MMTIPMLVLTFHVPLDPTEPSMYRRQSLNNVMSSISALHLSIAPARHDTVSDRREDPEGAGLHLR